MVDKVKLDIAIAAYPHTRKLISGEIGIEGVEANFIEVKPQIGAFRRMVRDVEFDVCELAPTTYIIARAYGAPFKALPIFVMRTFHHGTMVKLPDAGIEEPKDLEGRKVGIRAYSVTTCVWNRQILTEEYGVDISKITWVVDDEEHVQALCLPPNVVHAPEGRSLYEMMRDGEIVAGSSGNSGVGRMGSPTGGWKTVKTDWPKLIPDAAARDKAAYGATGVYPMHGTIVVKDEVLAEHPWVARSLYEAFRKARDDWMTDWQTGIGDTKDDEKYRKLATIVGDPLPYGIASNIKTIDALRTAAFKQGLTPRLMSVDEIFVDPAE
ncbi:ABC transporter substrate-binding protein [Frigidibacter sp. ROC022]|uniref:ABC transporter substrate-binding protein n=1 Tax=Frigidibacter sp. ROC022 TaxID=2971796 RepID=UPI00215AC3A6|nr:ABC transporter substrate-binding protein [Frigidibacter sp. ROC022]MCR8724519.1 ABC transporter substrate-binding protein [Frigidibacter sp. ROC022]